jgi:UDP-GlcNAc:undecaprenyl-phosphate GlcNAc-1-phosphate transferase
LWAPKDRFILASLLGGTIILLFGVWDDRVGLHYGMKFLGQVLAAAAVVAFAGVHLSTVPFFDDLLLPAWVAIPLTLVVIVGLTNAINLADGLDGLAGGLSLLSFAGIAYLAHQAGDPLLVLLMVSVLGGLLGFLRFNTYPAKIFMGDAGSQFLGHYLAVAAIFLTDSSRTAYSPLLALLLWGVPLLDTIGVMGQRLAEGRSPFIGDRNHIHHKLLAMGLSHRQAVTLIYVVHGLMVFCAYLLRWQSDIVLLAVYAGFATAVFSVFVRSFGRPAVAGLALLSRESEGARRLSMGTWSFTLLEVIVVFFIVVSAAHPREIPRDAGFVAAGLLTAVIGGMLFPRWAAWLVRAGLYVGSTFIVYYGEIAPRSLFAGLANPINLGFALLAVLVILAIRSAGEDRFQTTPLDYLILLVALVMPFLPDMTVGEVPVSLITAKLIVLFFAFELLLHDRAPAVIRLGWVTSWMLGVLMIRAWWL